MNYYDGWFSNNGQNEYNQQHAQTWSGLQTPPVVYPSTDGLTTTANTTDVSNLIGFEFESIPPRHEQPFQQPLSNGSQKSQG